MGCGIRGMGFGCNSGEHIEAQGMHWCSGGRMKTQMQFHCQGGLQNRRNLPRLMLGSKHITSCQHQPPSCNCASSSAGRAAGGVLVRLQRAHANPRPAVPPGSSAGSPGRTCQTCLFPGFVTLSYPLTRSRVRRGPAATAQPCPTGLPVVLLPERKDFLPAPQWMLSPLLQEGCTATLLMGILPWQLQAGLGYRKTSVTLPEYQDFVPCWGHQGRAQGTVC